MKLYAIEKVLLDGPYVVGIISERHIAAGAAAAIEAENDPLTGDDPTEIWASVTVYEFDSDYLSEVEIGHPMPASVPWVRWDTADGSA